MPKKNNFRGNGNRVWNNPQRNAVHNYLNEHDDRDRKPNLDLTIRKDNNRRVSFKTAGARPNNIKHRVAEMGIRARLEDDDDVMDVRGDGMPRARRRGSPIPRSARGKARLLVDAGSGWFHIVIPYGHKYDKDFLVKALLQATAPVIFIPHYWKVESSAIAFYVDDISMARALLDADRNIELPDGFKLIIKVRNGIPPVTIDPNMRELMRRAMEMRFSPVTRALDLTKFHADHLLSEVFCGLSRPTVMMAAVDIIAENIPDLQALNLDSNKISNLDHFKQLVIKLPNLRILHLSNNKITAINSLEVLKASNIIDIVLTGNPLRNRFRDETVYVSEIRKRLPKLRKLDGMELPPQIGFDIEEDESNKVPAPKASFLSVQSGGDIVRQFLEQFYMIYDSDNRQPLLNAYHEHSTFSMTCTFSQNPNHKLFKYLPHNRNIIRVRDLEQRCSFLKNGRLPIVSFLSELPATEHDAHSFGVDLTVYTPALILITITGIFREQRATQVAGSSFRPNQQPDQPLRSFQRTLVIVPCGGGYCIMNDMLHITTLTMNQVRSAFKPLPTAVAMAPIVPDQPAAAAPAVPMQAAAPVLDEATKLRMIQEMSNRSQMNLEWSKKCLEQTDWDFERAGYVFSELQKQNKIPPEAFAK